MMGLLVPELALPEAMLDRDGLRDVATAWAELAADEPDWIDVPARDDAPATDAERIIGPARPRGR